MDTIIIDKAFFNRQPVSEMYQGDTLVWPMYEPRLPEDYFTIKKMSGSGVIRCRTDKTGMSSEHKTPNVLYYWKNTIPNRARNNYTGIITAPLSTGSSAVGVDIPVSAGDIVMFWRKEKTRFCGIGAQMASFDELDDCVLYGNLASLCNWADTLDSGETTTYQWNAGQSFFQKLFYNTGVVSAKDLILPWNEVPSYTFFRMFQNCRNLIDQPNLPATVLGGSCYSEMFIGCNSLTTAILPTTISNIPLDILYNELQGHQFDSMYMYCSGLTSVSIPEYDSSVYSRRMFDGIFESCDNITTAIVGCPENLNGVETFFNMFRGCSLLNDVTCLAKTISNDACLAWLEYVSSTGTFTKHSSANWIRGVDGIPTGWTVVNAS